MDKEYKKATADVQTLKSKLQEMRIKCQTEVDEKETEFKETQERLLFCSCVLFQSSQII